MKGILVASQKLFPLLSSGQGGVLSACVTRCAGALIIVASIGGGGLLFTMLGRVPCIVFSVEVMHITSKQGCKIRRFEVDLFGLLAERGVA